MGYFNNTNTNTGTAVKGDYDEVIAQLKQDAQCIQNPEYAEMFNDFITKVEEHNANLEEARK